MCLDYEQMFHIQYTVTLLQAFLLKFDLHSTHIVEMYFLHLFLHSD